MHAKRRLLAAVLPLVIIILIPVMLRRGTVRDDPAADQLVIISPHNEAIRYEFEGAFRSYYREQTGRDVDLDWRTPGGTSEIVRYIESSYTAAFRQEWIRQGGTWSAQVQTAFKNRKLTSGKASPEQWKARQAFLNSTVGIGIDLFFGGGQYDFGKFAAVGFLVPGGVRERHPEWFEEPNPIISAGLSGETWSDAHDRYYGACLSAFGICYNLDRMKAINGNTTDNSLALDQWSDLANPALFGQIGVADPSKSGSITKCFEMVIQQQMAQTRKHALQKQDTHTSPKQQLEPIEQKALAQGWENAMLLIRQIAANAKYFTFSASKVPVDVANGHVAAGMCIDFYGRSQAEWEQQHVGRKTMQYNTPEGGSSVSADPIGMLRGAPHPDTAAHFLDFVLSKNGQRLWNYRPGTPGGPDRYALRRLPIRRDLYTPTDRTYMSDSNAQPFELADTFTYHPEWTGRLFGLIRILIRVMTIDCQEELRNAWKAILEAGGPSQCPEAMRLLAELPFTYHDAPDMIKAVQIPENRIATARQWAHFFRERYAKAAAAAKNAHAKAGTP